jgi:cytochrome c biogenesis factor
MTDVAVYVGLVVCAAVAIAAVVRERRDRLRARARRAMHDTRNA